MLEQVCWQGLGTHGEPALEQFMKNCSQWKASVGQVAGICVQEEECDLSLMVAVNRQADPLGFVKSTSSIDILAFTQPQKYL